MNRKQKSLWEIIYNSNIFIIVLMLLLVLSVLKVGKELARRHQINQEIATLNEELIKSQANQEKLESLITYLKTDQYIEEQARLQLNLSKPGEKRIDLSGGDDLLETEQINQGDLSNLQKWFDYFLKQSK